MADDDALAVFWLSFADTTRPEGDRFLGVAIVAVDAADLAEAQAIVRARFPHARPGADRITAAMRKAWALGCNPGGEVGSYELPPGHPARAAPRGCLLSRAALETLGLIEPITTH